MAARLREARQDPGFPDLVVGWLIAVASFAAGRVATVAAWIGIFALVAVLLVLPAIRATRNDRRRRLMLLVSGLVTVLLISAMASSALILGVLGLIFFLVTFLFGWELARAKRLQSEMPATRSEPTANS
jgi:Ca2+/Na+ antiporter